MRTTILAYAIGLVGLLRWLLEYGGSLSWFLRGCAFVCAPDPEYSPRPCDIMLLRLE
jgi:hypothetical protein